MNLISLINLYFVLSVVCSEISQEVVQCQVLGVMRCIYHILIYEVCIHYIIFLNFRFLKVI